MNILQLCDFSAPYRGNFIESLEAIAQNTSYNNVYVFPQRAQHNEAQKWIQEMQKRGVAVYFLSSSWRKNIQLINQLIKQYDIKLVHTHFFGFKIWILGYFWTRKVPFVYHVHGSLREVTAKKDKLLWRMYTAFKQKTAPFILAKKTLIGCSSPIAQETQNMFPKSYVHSVPNAIDFTRLDTKITNPFNANAPYKIGLLGYNFFIKGVDIALQAAKQLQAQGKNFKLYLIFATNPEENTKQLLQTLRTNTIPNWIEILPPTNQIGSYFKQFDCFLSPSRSEGFAYAIAEAAYCGCQVIAADCAGQLQHKNMPYIRFFPSENYRALASEIEHVMAKPLTAEEKTKLKDYCVQNYSLSVWAKQVGAIYDRILQQNSLNS